MSVPHINFRDVLDPKSCGGMLCTEVESETDLLNKKTSFSDIIFTSSPFYVQNHFRLSIGNGTMKRQNQL